MFAGPQLQQQENRMFYKQAAFTENFTMVQACIRFTSGRWTYYIPSRFHYSINTICYVIIDQGAAGSRFSSRPSSARSSASSVRSQESIRSRESAKAAAIDIGAAFSAAPGL